MKEFLEWEQGIKQEVDHVAGLLREKMSDEPIQLIKDLEEIESWGPRLNMILAEANSFLSRFKALKLPSRESGTTLDRETLMNSEIAPVRQIRDAVEALCDGIGTRISLGQSILSYNKAMRENMK